jgi:hypothetical protein
MKQVKYFFILFSTITIVSLVSCKDDAIRGCTDPEAENYDSGAEENDASSCIFPRDKFVGEYTGGLNCAAVLGLLINGDADFSIDESSKGVKFVDITINTTQQVLRLEAEVFQDTMNINTFIPGLTVAGIVYDLTATGKVGISEDEQTVNGVLSIFLDGELSDVQDDCEITGTKK